MKGRMQQAIEAIRTGHPIQAKAILKQFLAVYPDHAVAWANLGSAERESGCVEAALVCYQRALEQSTVGSDADWIWSNYLMTLHYREPDDFESCWQVHNFWSRSLKPASPMLWRNRMIPNRRLHVGLVSGDFRWHSVAFFLLALLRNLDRERFELTCFSDVSERDEMTDILHGHAHAWVDIHQRSGADVLQRIRRSRIDVLVDLSGHTAHNRMEVFAQRAAPVQLSWLGYPGPTANPEIDYWMTDACICPPAVSYPWNGSKPLFLEPGCHVYHPPMQDCELPLLDEPVQEHCSVVEAKIVLGSFNHRAKLSSETLRMWAEVLHAAPATHLLLKSRCYEEPEAKAQLLQEFAQLGVEANRVELLPRTPSTREHLEIYRRLDIALDTYPYAGTTTTFESLWMGVPVVTRFGASPSSRVGASILQQLGEPSWIAGDREGFTRAVLDLIKDVPKRRQFRSEARGRLQAQGLTDGVRFARVWEAGIQSVWNDAVQRFASA